MSKLGDVKRCIIAGWPNVRLDHCVAMAMLDYGLPCLKVKANVLYADSEKTEQFLHSLNMYSAHFGTRVDRYLGDHYPKTSAALFDKGKEAALPIFLKETRSTVKKYRGRNTAKENRDINRTLFVKARSLSKWHDWNTVK